MGGPVRVVELWGPEEKALASKLEILPGSADTGKLPAQRVDSIDGIA